MASGIYRIRVERGDKPPRFYVGQASNLSKRQYDHFRTLRRGVHKNQPLQRAFRKYGEKAFAFEVLIICSSDKCILAMYEYAVLHSYADGEIYNMCRQCVGSKLGVSMSAETKAKIGAANKGNIISEAHKESVRRAHVGRKHSQGTIEKRRVKMIGNKHSVGVKMSEERKVEVGNFFRGKKRDPEIMARIVATRKANWEIRGYKRSAEAVEKTARKNRGRKLSSEHRAKLGAAGRGRSLSKEHKEAISAFHRGRPKSPEAKSKISLSLKQRNRELKEVMIAYSMEAM